MNITLGQEFERRIAKKVESGLYTSASEVIRESLRLLFDKDLLKEKQINILHQEVIKGFKQLEQGEYTELSMDELFHKLIKESNVY
jgi:antitoxin ParD1/3/4